jgi:NAD(P)-dependent dehydrogenase (short-subunit alcohol dehydrogenase family)
MDVKGSTALVTGANRGVGRAVVEALLARGAAKVYAAARRSRPSRIWPAMTRALCRSWST